MDQLFEFLDGVVLIHQPLKLQLDQLMNQNQLYLMDQLFEPLDSVVVMHQPLKLQLSFNVEQLDQLMNQNPLNNLPLLDLRWPIILIKR